MPNYAGPRHLTLMAAAEGGVDWLGTSAWLQIKHAFVRDEARYDPTSVPVLAIISLCDGDKLYCCGRWTIAAVHWCSSSVKSKRRWWDCARKRMRTQTSTTEKRCV